MEARNYYLSKRLVKDLKWAASAVGYNQRDQVYTLTKKDAQAIVFALGLDDPEDYNDVDS